MFLRRRLISAERAYFYGGGGSLRERRNSEDEINVIKIIGLLLEETALFYIVKQWHSATVIKLLFRFSNLPVSIFVSQHLLKGVIKNKSSSVINTLCNRRFFSRAARSIFDHRPTRPRPTRAVQSRVIKLLSVHSIHS